MLPAWQEAPLTLEKCVDGCQACRLPRRLRVEEAPEGRVSIITEPRFDLAYVLRTYVVMHVVFFVPPGVLIAYFAAVSHQPSHVVTGIVLWFVFVGLVVAVIGWGMQVRWHRLDRQSSPWLTLSPPRAVRGMTADQSSLYVLRGRVKARERGEWTVERNCLAIVTETSPGQFMGLIMMGRNRATWRRLSKSLERYPWLRIEMLTDPSPVDVCSRVENPPHGW